MEAGEPAAAHVDTFTERAPHQSKSILSLPTQLPPTLLPKESSVFLRLVPRCRQRRE